MFIRVRQGTALINTEAICLIREVDTLEEGASVKWYEAYFTSGNANTVLYISAEDYQNILQVIDRTKGIM